ncbi:MAG: T9SS type A sorting domain-containing protein [Bacteroidota bacterium]
MKKIVLSLLFLAATFITVAQTGQRQMVLAEDFTSTLCTYCPGAAMGMDDLLSNGKFVAVIAEHSNYGNNDPFKNVYSLARNSMYGVSAYPTVGFDGLKMYCGGNHSSTMYASYLPLYNSLIVLPSPVNMTMVISHTGLNYTAVITLVKTDVITSTSNILYFFVTQSGITYNWEGQTHLEHVNRLMAPDQNGVAVDFTSGNTQTVTLNYAMDPTWPLADCEFIATLQNKDAGQGNQTGSTGGYPIKAYQVLQTIKQGAINLAPDFTVASNTVVTNTPVTFTNTTTGGYIGVPETYEWIFQGGTPVSSFDANPVVSYANQGTYDVTLIVNRGGQIDTLVKPGFITANFPVGVQENQTVIATKISPNPSTGIVTLDVFSGKNITVNVSVINSINVPVYQEEGINFTGRLTRTINLSNVAKGIYFVVVDQEGSKTVKKLIIN